MFSGDESFFVFKVTVVNKGLQNTRVQFDHHSTSTNRRR